MKIRIELDPSLNESEIIIKTNTLDDQIKETQNLLQDHFHRPYQFTFLKEGKEYYFPVQDIIFFESSDTVIQAHTKDDIYTIKSKLYELENILPSYFVRISKSTILNISSVLSITHNFTSPNIVEFYGTHKHVYVSRHYIKILKEKLNERRK